MFTAFQERATAQADTVAIVQHEKSTTYAELVDLSLEIANSLRVAGHRDAEPITIQLPNCRELLASVLAASRLGAQCVIVAPSATRTEIENINIQARGRIAVSLTRQAARLPHEIILTVDDGSDYRADDNPPDARVRHVPAIQQSEKDWAGLPPTSSTEELLTVHPCPQRHGGSRLIGNPSSSLIRSGRALTDHVGIGPRDTVIAACALDLAVCFVSCLVGPLLAGARVVIVKHPRPKPVFDAIAAHQATVVLASPSMYQLLRASYDPACLDITGVRTWLSVGPPTTSDLQLLCEHDMGIRLRTIYGTTEALIGLVEPEVAPDEPAGREHNSYPYASLGTPLPGVNVQVVSADGQTPITGTEGLITLRTPWQHSSPNAEGQEEPGSICDVGVLSARGQLHYVGPAPGLARVLDRLVDLTEVARTLERDPAVLAARAYANPDEFYGNLVGVELQLDPASKVTVSQIIDELRGRLAFYKLPKSFRFVR